MSAPTHREAGARRMLEPFLRKEWRALTGASVLTVFLAAADLAKPWPLAILIDRVFRGRTDSFELGAGDLRMLGAVAGLTIGIAAVDALANYRAELLLERAGERINHSLRVALYDRLQRLSLGFHQRSQTGDLVARVTGDVDAIGSLFSGSLGTIAQSALLLAGMIVVTMWIDPLLAVCSLPAVPVLAVLAHRFRRQIKQQSRLQRAEDGAIASLATEALSAMPAVKASGAEAYERSRVWHRSRLRMQFGIRIARLTARFDGLGDTLVAAATALVIVVGALRVAGGAITAGTLIVFASYARKVNTPLRSLVKELTRASAAMARAERISEILETEEFLEERPGAYAGERAAGEIELDDVHFSFQADRPVLEGVSLTIAAGSRVAIVGPSGAGKSTLAAIMARFHDPQSGRVLLDGRDLRDCSTEWLRGQIGVILQDTMLFSGTVGENIAYACGGSAASIVAAAELAAASVFIDRLPQGYATQLGPRGTSLSGGQRQRIGIARTLLRDPPILVLDEPTTALDAVTEAQLLDGLDKLMQGRTTILITHSSALARTADTVVVVEGGRIVRQGPPDVVLGNAEGRPAPAAAQVAETDANPVVLDRPELIVVDRGPVAGAAPRPIAGPASGRIPAGGAVVEDPALPSLGRLLDPDAMAPVLVRTLGDDRSLGNLAVRGVRYQPGLRVTVRYEAVVDGRVRQAVVMTKARGDLESKVRRADYLAAARAVDDRSPAHPPVSYAPAIRAIVSWLPFDLRLPALLEPPAGLLRALREAGVAVDGPGVEPVLLTYEPQVRAVLRLGDHILKAYGRQDDFEGGVAGLEVSQTLSFGVPLFEGSVPRLRFTVQSAADGERPRALDAALEAGDLLRRLHGSGLGGLRVFGPEQQIDTVRRGVELVRALAPEADRMAEGVLSRLAAVLPPADGLVSSHGDFHAGQLMESGGRLTMLDFDSLRMGLPALDIARYAADELTGLDGDGQVEALLEALLAAYGPRPEALAWHLAAQTLRRAARPFRLQLDAWPDRMVGLVQAAGRMLSFAASR